MNIDAMRRMMYLSTFNRLNTSFKDDFRFLMIASKRRTRKSLIKRADWKISPSGMIAINSSTLLLMKAPLLSLTKSRVK